MTSPAWRAGQGMAYDHARREIVLFGGAKLPSGLDLGDTWTWDGRTWTEQFPKASPDPVAIVGMAYDAARREVVLFGGYGEGGFREGTWTWDGETWSKESPAVSPPPGAPHLAYDRARREVVAWFGSDWGTWTWDGSAWTEEHPIVSPPQLVEARMVYDNGNAVTLLFGGEVDGQKVNDLWAWDGSDWSKVPVVCSR